MTNILWSSVVIYLCMLEFNTLILLLIYTTKQSTPNHFDNNNPTDKLYCEKQLSDKFKLLNVMKCLKHSVHKTMCSKER